MKKEECNCSNDCTCGDNCECTEDNRCNPNCTCPEDKKKHHGKHHENCKHHEGKEDCHCKSDKNHEDDCHCDDDCECEHDECECGDGCHCDDEYRCEDGCDHDHNECDCEDGCDCEHDDCDCDECHPKTQEEAFAMYEKAFRQLEDALIKADKELTKEKARADENEHLARVYKQDLERFKARNANAEEENRLKANGDTAVKLLPILDNFSQALASVQDASVAKGFAMINASIKEIVASLGVEEIEALGQKFDPELHDCIAKTTAHNKNQAGLVSRIFKAGYKFKGENGKVLRHSVVEIYE